MGPSPPSREYQQAMATVMTSVGIQYSVYEYELDRCSDQAETRREHELNKCSCHSAPDADFSRPGQQRMLLWDASGKEYRSRTAAQINLYGLRLSA